VYIHPPDSLPIWQIVGAENNGRKQGGTENKRKKQARKKHGCRKQTRFKPIL
jgi:hypothetical protein